MRRTILYCVLQAALLCSICTGAKGQLSATVLAGAEATKGQEVRFRENRGQVRDQNGDARADVLFQGSSQGQHFFIRNNGLSFQFERRVPQEKETKPHADPISGIKHRMDPPVAEPSILHRVDINWLNARADLVVEKGRALPGYTNHYDVALGSGPALDVREYASLTMRDIWPGVDLEYHARKGVIETEWTMADPAYHQRIAFEVEGAEVKVDPEGYLVMTSPFGVIREGRIQADQNGVPVEVEWVVHGKAVSIRVPHYDAQKPLRIDPPYRIWGTYMGGSDQDYAWNVAMNGTNGIYVAGSTYSTASIATTGAHQTTLSGTDGSAYLAKFSTGGARLWATYYGGHEEELGRDCALMPNGDVILVGSTSSTSNIATPGAYQGTKSGSNDAFIARFTTNGVRIWGTYFGSTSTEEPEKCAVNAAGEIYLVGTTRSASGLATPGAHQTEPDSITQFDQDAYLAKFTTDGALLWCTYYGGTWEDEGFSCALDTAGNVYISGTTQSYNNIGTDGAFQSALQGGPDNFLAKFDPAGIRTWGTYYGGSNYDVGGYCATDALGHIFLVGSTTSDSFFATPGTHQQARAGEGDAFVAMFNLDGDRLWGSYFGGSFEEDGLNCFADGTGSVIVVGRTWSSDGIATPEAFDQSFAGAITDGYVAKFNALGELHWGTYLGGTNEEYLRGCVAAGGDLIHVCGYTRSTSQIAAGGAFDNSYNGGIWDMLLVKLDGCVPLPVAIAATALSVCELDTVQLVATGALTYAWPPAPGLLAAVGDSVFVVPATSGSYTVSGMDRWGCTSEASIAIAVVHVDTTVTTDGMTLVSAQANAQYQWVDCNTSFEAVPGATARAFSPAQAGNYAALITYNGCVDTTACWLALPVGIAAHSTERVALYPNPARHHVSYTLSASTIHTLRVMDARGRIVLQEHVPNTNSGTFSVAALAPDIYTVEFTGERTWRERLCIAAH